ncbi:28 kDa ribonucleoprotein, chloroplastic [Brachypodium distachyon]|uniref:RRM domain-containing protein n=1 Tax=Brachypodium distachyon TaxID=15368 RepID=I1I0I4_BRADI|nr:28 kDa ribonucleoprotein, chloroplastic [Brachypodium distachyon]KQJ94879.1 hypothetical protein BRADI_3g13790v3 [Brachypodium distachyon]|eukprot:XP_010234263.1 28 kDa ribonucleoprotein, chloroplastic [Brachypodium distachyon]
MASASFHALLLLHLPNPIHSRHLLSPRARRRHHRLRLARSSSTPVAFETEEAEAPRWSSAQARLDEEEEEEEQEWAGGNGAAAAHGEEEEEDGGESVEGDSSGWTQRSPRPRELFVCNLPRRCGVDDLLHLFQPYGTVLSVEVSRDPETGISRGCGFVTMRSLAAARTAMNALDGFDLDGREMFVKLASHVVSNRRNPSLSHTAPMKDHIFESPYKIYVGNLAWSVQPQHLRELFTQCGNIVSTRLLTDRKGARNRVYGFLSFSSPEELDAALKLNNTNFHGRDIIVREAHVKSPHTLS